MQNVCVCVCVRQYSPCPWVAYNAYNVIEEWRLTLGVFERCTENISIGFLSRLYCQQLLVFSIIQEGKALQCACGNWTKANQLQVEQPQFCHLWVWYGVCPTTTAFLGTRSLHSHPGSSQASLVEKQNKTRQGEACPMTASCFLLNYWL